MSADWYLLAAILGPDLGLLLVVASAPFLIYSFCARNRPRAYTAGKIAVVLSLVSVFVSAILWLQLLSGYYRYDNPVDYRDPDFMVYEVIAGLEVIFVLISVLNAVRQRARRAS